MINNNKDHTYNYYNNNCSHHTVNTSAYALPNLTSTVVTISERLLLPIL